MGVYIGFNAKLAQEIYAGADIFLMPSQLRALRSGPDGLLPLRHHPRCPRDRRPAVTPSTIPATASATASPLPDYNAHELYEACWRAKEGYWQKDGWPVLVHRAMECDFSWSNSAKSYEGLYNEVVNLW